MAEAPAPPARHSFTIEDTDGRRLDLVVAQRLDMSRTQAATLIAGGHVTVNGKRERASFRAEQHATVDVELPPPPARTIAAESIPVDVVYEDEHLVVISKPAGMVVHPAPGHWSGTLVNALLGRHAGTAESLERAGLVHRLDKDTSGLLLVAKSERAGTRLSAALAARKIARRYAVLVRGHLDSDRQRVDAALARDPRNRKRMAVVTGGRRAVTDFVRIARFDTVDLLRAHLHSGRTHQIRVHLASIGHPVIGDQTYGGMSRTGAQPARQFLHAAWLRFQHPVTDAVVDLRSELPSELRALLARAARDESLADDPAPLATLGFFTIDA